jgi:hypothetical protein
MFDELEQKHSQTDPTLESIERNILLLGCTKSGKTTLKNILIDPRYQPEALLLCSSTVQQMTLDQPYDIGRLKLNIVDVPSRMIDQTSDLDQINKTCIDFGIAAFHLICFCVSVNIGINKQDIELFKRLIEHFNDKKINRNLGLIVTRCESKDNEWRAQIQEELEHDAHFDYVIQQLGRGVYFSGALNSQDWHQANEEPLLDQFRTVYEYRRILLQSIMMDIDPFVVEIRAVAKRSGLGEYGPTEGGKTADGLDLRDIDRSEPTDDQGSHDFWRQSAAEINSRTVSSTPMFE